MENYTLSEPSLVGFILQTVALSCVFPLTYFAYKWVRAPQRSKLIRQDLVRLGVTKAEALQEIINHEYRGRDYLWPVTCAFILVAIIYSVTHPLVIRSGIWSGVLEEFVDIFGTDGVFRRELVAGRFLFWGFIGAWVYSLNLVLRRFMAYDLTPSVYVFIISRFALAWLLGAIVGMGLGVFSHMAGVSPNVNLTSIDIVAFFIGFFPERGLSWLSKMAKSLLRQRGDNSNEASLSRLEGISIWQQGRLEQEGIENVHNLAMCSVPALLIATPFTVGQLVDWIDQAILLVYANEDMYAALEKVGIRCASDFLTATSKDELMTQLTAASKLDINRIKMLHLAVESATNVNLTANFRWRSSLNKERNQAAKNINPLDTMTVVAVTAEEVEQEEKREEAMQYHVPEGNAFLALDETPTSEPVIVIEKEISKN